ncbi:thioredoxin family protein [Exiguobacterium sp. SH3S2]|uniref:thioredoxin family protein n=1 Tax=unclassified Exiguobacterium TaxID=2644629 RepID=UPI00103B2E01|nr:MULTISPECIES: thioredoxin family protein [unclassified Exiguobacterium]TCI24450.1 thioredoxin family protein [Exiguobacterium sp. SH5S4]TCI46293.1 thioredoxin family protein [Exiguobacterium sp. SH3S3]TCI57020.1 thioredoxin family protein [Exiguobacterium sp. SH5S13]TCI61934.1 thioredoxin family protein [Exiguobacterium sp. SH3S2]TCI62803.1 thioredoxin family protein [Exiguobacterium sp. SH3S1]
MNIKILGTGCRNCKTLEQNVVEALRLTGKTATVEKVTDIEQIMSYGIMSTPGLVVNEEIKSVGTVLTPKSIAKFF